MPLPTMELSLLPIEPASPTPPGPAPSEVTVAAASAVNPPPAGVTAVAEPAANPTASAEPTIAGNSTSAPATADADRYLAAATREYEGGKIDRPLWERAVELADGDHGAAVPGYLRARATAMRLAGRERPRSSHRQRQQATPTEPTADAADGGYGDAAHGRRKPRGLSLRGWPLAAIGAGALAVSAAWFLLASPDDAGVTAPASSEVRAAHTQVAPPPAPSPVPQVDTTAEREAKVQELLRAGNWNVLVLHAAEWTRKEPANASAWKFLSLGYANLKQNEDAFAAGERAAQLAPTDRETWKNLGRLGVAAGQPESALRAYEKAVELDPQDATSLAQVGRLQAELGRPAQAKVSLDRALAIAANDPDALCAQAQLALAQGRGKEAEAIARELRRLSKECSLAEVAPAAVTLSASTAGSRPAPPRGR
jgi:tetratricopeptide (TPR) repeat protein